MIPLESWPAVRQSMKVRRFTKTSFCEIVIDLVLINFQLQENLPGRKLKWNKLFSVTNIRISAHISQNSFINSSTQLSLQGQFFLRSIKYFLLSCLGFVKMSHVTICANDYESWYLLSFKTWVICIPRETWMEDFNRKNVCFCWKH